jgi:hypothetical protein
VRFSATVGVVFGEEDPFPPPPSLFFFPFFLLLVVFLLPIVFLLYPPLPTVLLLWVARLLPLLAIRCSPLIVLHEAARSTLVLRWVLKNLQSTYLRSTRAYMHHSTVTTGLSTLQRHLAIRRPRCTRRDVSSTRLSVDLMRRRVSPMLRAAASSCNLFPWTVQPFGCSSTYLTVTISCLVFCCFSDCIFDFVFSCIFLLVLFPCCFVWVIVSIWC